MPQCAECGKVLTGKGSATKCAACAQRAWRAEKAVQQKHRKEARSCTICGKEFDVWQTSSRVTCGLDACRRARRKLVEKIRYLSRGESTCAVCGKILPPGHAVLCGSQECAREAHRLNAIKRRARQHERRNCPICGVQYTPVREHQPTCQDPKCVGDYRRAMDRQRWAKKVATKPQREDSWGLDSDPFNEFLPCVPGLPWSSPQMTPLL